MSKMQQRKDYYKILEINQKANKKQIRQQYRKLAFKFHPDKNPDDPSSKEKFQEVKEAYNILFDENSRRKYDLGEDVEGEYLRTKTFDIRDLFQNVFFFQQTGNPFQLIILQ